MKNLTLEQHRARIDNIRDAEQSNKKYYARHRIHDYLSGQVIYNLGEYPAPDRKSTRLNSSHVT